VRVCRDESHPSGGFHQFKKCTSLRVLDISDCKLSFNFSEFKRVLFDYIKAIQKIQYLAIKNNPVADIADLRLYIIRELSELKVLDWVHVTKEVS
jgi:Ran GTPase-activating protein (RanGAP) involved in mRNA processing and transport